MTDDFNQLMELFDLARGNVAMKPLMESLADRCIRDADHCRPSWDFKSWKTQGTINRDRFEIKREYLGDCHLVLDHNEGRSYRVLSDETQLAIRFLHELLIEKRDSISVHIIPDWFKKQATVLLKERRYLRGAGVWFHDEELSEKLRGIKKDDVE